MSRAEAGGRTVLFIENREKTAVWEQVALRLRQQGHRIVWLVQNPAFSPRAFAGDPGLHRLPWPRLDPRSPEPDTDWVARHHPALLGDRGRNHFGAGARHYDHYAAEIERVLLRERPDLVVGESTLFHELLTIAACERLGLHFVHPCANRYPAGRFALFRADTQEPAAASGETWPAERLHELAERIASNREVPFYMRRPGRLERLARRGQWAVTRARVWWARLRGERFNTPSLRCKWQLSRALAGRLAQWRTLAALPRDPARTLMYPLQLQPEANIDVWGRPHSDQLALIAALLAAAPADVQIAVKANPKAKYELSAGLLALAGREPRLCLLPLDLPMAEAHGHCRGSVTVSGTVGLEAVFGKGRCLSLRHPVLQQHFPSFHAASPAEAVQRLLGDPAAGCGTVAEGARLLGWLVAHSFPGLVSDPLSHPACMEEDNIARISAALGLLLAPAVPTSPKELVSA